MKIEVIQTTRDDGAILQTVKIPQDMKLENLNSEERHILATHFIAAAHHLLVNVPTGG